MTRSDDGYEIQPEIFSLHWEGPPRAETPQEPVLPGSEAERREARERERQRELREVQRTQRGQAIWGQIEKEAKRRGDSTVWERKLHAYAWVKMAARGSAADYARRYEVNHATVRTWIADVAKLAYEVGYRLHEDRLLLVGAAPEALQELRERVNEEPGSPAAWRALRAAEAEFRGEDPYYHLNEGHVLRARGELRGSDATLCVGLTIAEARPIRALLWNARGQTFWDCAPGSSWPLDDHLQRCTKAFRRAALLDPSSYFAFVNLAQLAADEGDFRRAEYWVAELASARKQMDAAMQADLARYLDQAEWSGAVGRTRWWRSGPLRWIREAARAGALALALAIGALAWTPPSYAADDPGLDVVSAPERGGSKPRRGGAGGN